MFNCLVYVFIFLSTWIGQYQFVSTTLSLLQHIKIIMISFNELFQTLNWIIIIQNNVTFKYKARTPHQHEFLLMLQLIIPASQPRCLLYRHILHFPWRVWSLWMSLQGRHRKRKSSTRRNNAISGARGVFIRKTRCICKDHFSYIFQLELCNIFYFFISSLLLVRKIISLCGKL